MASTILEVLDTLGIRKKKNFKKSKKPRTAKPNNKPRLGSGTGVDGTTRKLKNRTEAELKRLGI